MIDNQEEIKPASWKLILMLIVCILLTIGGALLSLVSLAFSGEPGGRGDLSLMNIVLIFSPFVLPISLAFGIMKLWSQKLYKYSYIVFFTALLFIFIAFLASSGVFY